MRVKETAQYSVSQGWSETFSFDLTYHEHLFWNLQVSIDCMQNGSFSSRLD